MPTNSTDTLAVIDVTGDDAATFLQGQLTCDVTRIEPGKMSLGAWCNPKGRVIALFHIRRHASGFALLVPGALAEAIVKRLTMYRFRAKVELSLRAATPADLDGADVDEWQAENLRAGIATIAAPQSEKFTPHMLNLDLLGAVSFDKGCYTGQEVVARTHYKGATRRRLMKFSTDDKVTPGDKVRLDDRDVGEVVNAGDGELLAVVPVDSAEAGLSVGGNLLSCSPLPYLDIGSLEPGAAD